MDLSVCCIGKLQSKVVSEMYSCVFVLNLSNKNSTLLGTGTETGLVYYSCLITRTFIGI